jgi:hypothetical protein
LVSGDLPLRIGLLLNHIIDNLDDCLYNVRTIADQAEVTRPAVERINATSESLGALPLLAKVPRASPPSQPLLPLWPLPASQPFDRWRHQLDLKASWIASLQINAITPGEEGIE